ncbi:MAG TPA: hypothetical protein VF519_05740 [Mycobacteriales bacterium]|jgi:hypothetical protein
MTRFLIAAPVAAIVALTGVSARAAGIPGIGQCLVVKETASQVGFQVCTPPIGQ